VDAATGNFTDVLEYTDAAFSTFFVYCHLAGPDKCPYYTGTTAHDIFLRFERTLARLDAAHAFQQNWSNDTLIASGLSSIKGSLHSNTYEPIEHFPDIAEMLVQAETIVQNITLYSEQQSNMTDSSSEDVGQRAVECK